MIYNTIVAILCGIFTALPIYKIFQIKNNVKKCWTKIQCTPMGQILFPLFGPKDVTASQNQYICESGKFSTMFNSKIGDVNNGVNILNNTVSSINDDVNYVKSSIYNLQITAINDLKNVARSFSKIYDKIGNLGITIFDTIKNILQIFKNVVRIGESAYFTFSSIWNGPIGKLAKTFG
tara:strand:- start:306 stop:839 length:534 start_codon:yes stop_codon:yes gene_type:complete